MLGKKVNEQKLSKSDYLKAFSDEDLQELMFKGYIFKVTMSSGGIFTTVPLYLRGKWNENYFIDTLKDLKYCLTDKSLEIATKYIVSLEVLSETESLYIGEKAWESINFKLMGQTSSSVQALGLKQMEKLLTMDV